VMRSHGFLSVCCLYTIAAGVTDPGYRFGCE
jgi:hypothetical protein